MDELDFVDSMETFHRTSTTSSSGSRKENETVTKRNLTMAASSSLSSETANKRKRRRMVFQSKLTRFMNNSPEESSTDDGDSEEHLTSCTGKAGSGVDGSVDGGGSKLDQTLDEMDSLQSPTATNSIMSRKNKYADKQKHILKRNTSVASASAASSASKSVTFSPELVIKKIPTLPSSGVCERESFSSMSAQSGIDYSKGTTLTTTKTTTTEVLKPKSRRRRKFGTVSKAKVKSNFNSKSHEYFSDDISFRSSPSSSSSFLSGKEDDTNYGKTSVPQSSSPQFNLDTKETTTLPEEEDEELSEKLSLEPSDISIQSNTSSPMSKNTKVLYRSSSLPLHNQINDTTTIHTNADTESGTTTSNPTTFATTTKKKTSSILHRSSSLPAHAKLSSDSSSLRSTTTRTTNRSYGRYNNRQSFSFSSSSSTNDDDCASSILSYGSSPSDNVITGAGTDVLAVQDAGSHLFTLEDCSYLCSSFLSSYKHCNKMMEDDGVTEGVITHNSITAGSICDLVLMISTKKTRGIVVSMGSNDSVKNSNKEKGIDDNAKVGDNDSTVDLMLKMFRCISSSMINMPLPLSMVATETDHDDDDDGNDNGNQDLGPEADVWDNIINTTEEGNVWHSDKTTIGNEGEKKCRTKNSRKKSTDTSSSSKKRRQQSSSKTDGDSKLGLLIASFPQPSQVESVVALSLAMLAHFLSFDCTDSSEFSSLNNLAPGRSFRRAVLKHEDALCGISKLLLADSLVSEILRMNATQRNNNVEQPVEHINFANEITSPLEPTQVVDKLSEKKSEVKKDPTAMGRRKRKRRKIGNEEKENIASNLDTIQEDSESHQLLHDGTAKAPLPCLNDDRSSDSRTSGGLDFISSKGSCTNTTGSGSENGAKGHCYSDIPRKFRQKLLKVQNRIIFPKCDKDDLEIQTQIESLESLNCEICQIPTRNDNESRKHHLSHSGTKFNPSSLALAALDRILSGKVKGEKERTNEEGETLVDDTDGYDDEKCSQESEGNASVELENLDNPLIFKNVMLRESNSLPFLARAMSRALEALSCILENLATKEVKSSDSKLKESNSSVCVGCLSYLRHKINALSSMIDGACCLSDENRKLLCVAGATADQVTDINDAVLIPSLMRVICRTVIGSSNVQDLQCNDILSDISLSAFRTLTSLTHENEPASQQLIMHYDLRKESLILDYVDVESGVVVILHILHHLVEGNVKTLGTKECYDASIFCLNMLTNILETPSFDEARRQMYLLSFGTSDGNKEHALSWLTRWVVSQTSTYRHALMGSFGDNSSQETSRDLESHEDEHLIMAGNGFILLACLMRDRDEMETDLKVSDNEKEHTQLLRNLILSQMPKDDDGNEKGIVLMIKALKAFCNFYRFSIGDLSVAIVAPVLKIVKDLETIFF